MNKQELVRKIIDLLSLEAKNLANAAKTARADATNAESKAENKYDTRGLEASYLAGAQAKMAAECAENIAFYKTLKLKDFTNKSKIALTALVEIEANEGKRIFYFLGPKGGGAEIEQDGVKILVVTPSSPLGGKLIGREVGDCLTMSIGDTIKEYEIISIE